MSEVKRVAKLLIRTVEETEGMAAVVIVSDGEIAVAGCTRLSEENTRLLLEEAFKKTLNPDNVVDEEEEVG